MGALLSGCLPSHGTLAWQELPGPVSTEAPEERSHHPVEELGPGATLEELLRRAVESNPELRRAYQLWDAHVARIDAAEAWPEPVLGLQAWLDEARMGAAERDFAVRLTQTLPARGKLRAAGAEAAHRADAAVSRLRLELYSVQAELKRAWYELYYVDRARVIVMRNRDLLQSLEEVIRRRYGSGEAGFGDLLQTQIEIARLEDDLVELEDRRAPLIAAINALVDRPARAPLHGPFTIGEPAEVPPDDVLLELLVERSPSLEALERDTLAAEQRLEGARLVKRADWTVGLEYVRSEEVDSTSSAKVDEDVFVASVTLPLMVRTSAYRGIEREARARYRATLLERAGTENQLLVEGERLIFRMRDAERRIGLYREELLPIARQALEVTEADYKGGKTGLVELFNAERQLLDLELSLERAVTDRAQVVATFEKLLGPLDASPQNGGSGP